jgi:hypothetical protein
MNECAGTMLTSFFFDVKLFGGIEVSSLHLVL